MVANRTINGVVITDENKRIEWVNEGFTRITGYTLDEVRGKKPGDLLQGPETDAATRRYMHERLKRKEGFTAELINYRKSGEQFWVRVEVQPLLDESGTFVGYMGLETDITEQKEFERQLKKRASQQASIASLGQMALTVTDPLELMKATVEICRDVLEVDYTGIFQLTESGDAFMLEAGAGWQEEGESQPGINLYGKLREMVSRSCNQAVLEVFSSPSVLRSIPLMSNHQVKSGAGVQILDNDEPCRILFAGSKTDHVFSHDDVTFLQAVAYTLAACIQRNRMQEQLLAERNRAEEIARVKSEFLANMSHEIRTPLTGIIGFASVLSAEVTGQHHEFASLIEQSGRRLLDILNSVLDLAKLDSNQVDIELRVVDLAEVAEEVVRLLEPVASNKRLDLDLKVEQNDKPICALLDQTAFGRILQNLIGNAIKFTEEGKITIFIHSDEKQAYVSIQDTGIGIDGSFLPLIFEDFKQESRNVSRVFGGSGLGLSITKRLVNLMNGQINVESKKGEGSTFTVSFPRVEDTQKSESRGSRPELLPSIPQAHVLLVEDNPDTRFLMEHLLEDVFQVTTVSNGEEAIARMKERVFDLVLMDINLGDGPDGVDTLQKLRRIPGCAEIPVIALTAYALPGDRDRFLHSGFDGYLSKPFETQELLTLSSRLLTA